MSLGRTCLTGQVSTTTAVRGRGRPRNPEAESRVLDAALEEYAARGWSGFTMDAVAKRAGVGKSTLYLRWSDKTVLLMDAVSARQSTLWAVDTGSLRGDLEALADNLFRHYQQTAGWASLRLAVDANLMGSPWRDHGEELSWRHLETARPLLDRAVERGELDAGVDHRELVFSLCGSITMQCLRRAGVAEPLSGDEIARRAARAVRFVLSGAAATGSD